MPSFKKLALIATEIQGKTSAETAETATEPKTIPPAVFKNGREVKTQECPVSNLEYSYMKMMPSSNIGLHQMHSLNYQSGKTSIIGISINHIFPQVMYEFMVNVQAASNFIIFLQTVFYLI